MDKVEYKQKLREQDLQHLLETSRVTTTPKKIRHFSAKHGTYYCIEDICDFLEGYDAIRDSGKESWNWLKRLASNLADKMRKEDDLMGIDCFMMMGLCETYVHWVTIEAVLHKIIRKPVWPDEAQLLNREIDYEEGVLYPEFFENNFHEVEVQESGFNVRKKELV